MISKPKQKKSLWFQIQEARNPTPPKQRKPLKRRSKAMSERMREY
jgi:hypothetical protein